MIDPPAPPPPRPAVRALRTLVGVLALAILLPGLPSGLAGQDRSLTMESFHADLTVRESGELEVTETLRLRFDGSWNGIYRSIPVEYSTSYGANYTLRLDMDAITDETGEGLRYETDRSGRNRVFQIWVPGANDATRTVVLRYTVPNGIRFFEEHDELYWNITGNETEFPIEQASAVISLPEGSAGIRTAAFTGPTGSTEGSATISESGEQISVRTTEPLGFREGLTVVVGWNPGVVERPTALDRAWGFFVANSPLAIPPLAALGMFMLWRRRGRDPEIRPLMVEYEPPEGLTPAEAGTLIDNSPDMRDITSTLVDLAVRGFISIEEVEDKALFGLVSNQTFTFHLEAPRSRWSELKAHEREIMDALFTGRAEVNTEDLENSFYKHLPDIQRSLTEILVGEGHYLHHPTNVRAAYVGIAIVAGFVVAFGGAAVVAGVFGRQPLSAVVAGGLTAIVIAGFGMFMPARTQKGTRMLERLRGFEEFLGRVEGDRFERVMDSPELFERYLAYAMAFGVEKKWARAFDDIYRTPPDWYRGQGSDAFVAHAFASNLSGMTRATGAAMASAPRSSGGSSGGSSFSGSSGFSGGSSGGGFGGGGTSGF